MRKFWGIAVAIVAMFGVGSPTAAAATEFGNGCIADRAIEGQSFSTIQLLQSSGQVAAPSSGVITKWKIALVPEVPFGVPTQLKVYRPTANASQFQVVGESASENVVSGINTFSTRIPIHAGDHLGLFGSSKIGTLFCAEEPEAEFPGNVMGFFEGNPLPGSTASLFASESELLVPAVAVVEPDADGDGFGDETQDQCPQSAATQSPCPVITLDSLSLTGKSKITVYVAVSTPAPVQVIGSGKIGKKKVTLKSPVQTVNPGKLTRFTLKFPASLTKKLQELPKNKKVTLKVTASATNVAGQVSTDVSKVKLKG
jgi:hypothetical protein